MFVPDDLRKCVAYICFRLADGSMRFAGSVFFAGRPIADDIPDYMFGYAITARHVIDGIKDKGIASVFLRVNSRAGLKWIETDVAAWISHLDPLVDVAIYRTFLANDLDHWLWPVRGFLTSELIRAERVGVGEEVFFTGLFSQYHGKNKNIPIVRIGNIAAMPDEPVSTRFGLMQAYLIEARSIGGLSGSPAFINVGGGGPTRGNFVSTLARFQLLGIVHGHFDTDELEQDLIAEDGLKRTGINTGIAVVIPADKILEAINQFSEEEKTIADAQREKPFPTVD